MASIELDHGRFWLVAVLLPVFLAFAGYLWSVWKYWYYEVAGIMKESGFYYGEVRHSRLKGGATHSLKYPIFFAYLDLEEVELLQQKTNRRDLWPLFSVNRPYTSFCSFDYPQHLKDYPSSSSNNSLLKKVQDFLREKSKERLTSPQNYQKIRLLTHLTYFGYCFNPISVYYLFKKIGQEGEGLEGVIAEVSNTPWIEMHSYPLHETIEGVSITRNYTTDATSPSSSSLAAEWKKVFHVSPFMEMDYLYSFTFFTPLPSSLKCSSKMIKLPPQKEKEKEEEKKTLGDVWFTASFELKKLSFTPQNILYVLLFYPLHTRLIQVWIHVEALKLFWKGVPTFNHPQGSDVDFGLGITGERLGRVLWLFIAPFYWISSLITLSSSPAIQKKEKTKTTKTKMS